MKLLLKNAKIYDGSTNKPFHGNILIENDKISEIGMDVDDNDAEVLDCSHLSVAPGFIDAHSHNDFFMDRPDSEKFIAPFIEQGITTQVVGNCGFSTYCVNPKTQYKDKIGGGLFHSVSPNSLKEWKKRVNGNLHVNVVPLVGHGSPRISASGYKAGALTSEEQAEMLRLTEEDLKEGAFGGSFGFMYEPGMYAPHEECVEFAKLISKYDGILTVHPRACSNVSMGFPLLKPHHLELGLDEVVSIIDEAKTRCEYSHLIFTGEKSWSRLPSMLNKFKKLVQSGREIAYDLYSYTFGASVITVLLPSYYMALPPEKRHSGFIPIKTKFLLSITKNVIGLGFEDMIIAYISDEHKEYEGKSVAQIAKEENASNIKTYLKLVELSNGQGRIMMGKYYNPDIIKTLIKDDLSVFMTDAWIEEKGAQNASSFSAYPMFFKYAREMALPFQYIINKMTQKTAQRYKMEKRGSIKNGYFADLTIFDENIIQPNSNLASRPMGIEYVIINGKLVLKDGIYNNAKAGVVLEKH